jgi:hypothetical protein
MSFEEFDTVVTYDQTRAAGRLQRCSCSAPIGRRVMPFLRPPLPGPVRKTLE